MSIVVYIHKKCTTCRKALLEFEEQNMKPVVLDIVQNPPPKHHLALAMETYKERKKIMNTSGTIYKERGLKNSVDILSDTEFYALLSSEGMLVKRPFCIFDDKVACVGSSSETLRTHIVLYKYQHGW